MILIKNATPDVKRPCERNFAGSFFRIKTLQKRDETVLFW